MVTYLPPSLNITVVVVHGRFLYVYAGMVWHRWAEDQPSVVLEKSDPNYGKCLGYTSVPGGILCSGSHPDVARVCRYVLVIY
jgi:hypothetical protein